MSTERRTQLARLQKGADGRYPCRFCQKSVAPPRRTFCSENCVHEYSIRSRPQYARRFVFKRDKGVCAGCNLDTVMARQKFIGVVHVRGLSWDRKAREALAVELGLAARFGRCWGDTWWHMDHIKPVIEGGGECGLDNLRTLCLECHHVETVKLRKRLADAKRGSSSTN